jgi:hypothetical protein
LLAYRRDMLMPPAAAMPLRFRRDADIFRHVLPYAAPLPILSAAAAPPYATPCRHATAPPLMPLSPPSPFQPAAFAIAASITLLPLRFIFR